MKKDDLINDIKGSIVALVKEKYGEKSEEIEKDIEAFLEIAKDDLFRWGELLASKRITQKEFELLLTVQKDIFVINQLHQIGISKISLGHFKNTILNVIIASTLQAIAL